jgi:hypothetical protein
MPKSRVMRKAVIVLALAGLGSPALSQQIMSDRGITADLPYTIFYPDILQPVDDGSDLTVLTLQHPEAPLRCDIFAVPDEREGWTAEGALGNLDVAGIEATWEPDFPGFSIVGQQLTDFASGPALLYEGESEESPLGMPLSIVHAESVEAGHVYAVECLIAQAIAAEARPLVDFIIANFSTRSDGQCCIDPRDERG